MTNRQDIPKLIEGKELERHFELLDAMAEFARLFRDETNDRAMVIVGVSFLELQLEHIIRSFLVDDEKEVKSFVGTFARNTKLVYCLGLISGIVRDDLDFIREIRNRFAHKLYASFDDPQIKSWVSNLKFHRIQYMLPPEGAASRDIFNVGLNRIAGHLAGIVSIASGQKRKLPAEITSLG